MLYEGLDHVLIAASSASAAEPFERLGLRVTPPEVFQNQGLEHRAIWAGGPANLFVIALVSLARAGAAAANPFGLSGGAGQQGASAVRYLGLRVVSLRESLDELAGQGIQVAAEEMFAPDGAKLCDIAALPDRPEACARIALVQYVRAGADRYADLKQEGMLAHSIDLKRLDHLAAVAPNLEGATHFWQDVLAIPVWGEVVTATTVIRQMKVGDAIVELLGPAGPDSPIHSRPAGLNRMTAYEVADLEAAVATARRAGFSASDPVSGSLPETRVARIPGQELSGLTLQLLEYV